METTQAPAPGQPQAQTPVHPIISEQSTVERLTKYVRENPDNNPDHPTNSSAPEVPEAPQEAAPAEEAAVESEFDEDTPFFELDYNGEKKKLNAKELREGWLAKQDYHRNIQKVKQEQAELPQKLQQAQLQAAQEYAQKLEFHKQAVTKLAGVKTLPEIEALSREDPAAAQQEFLRMISVNQTIQAIESEQRAANEKLQQAQKSAMQQAITKARETLESDIPGWNEEVYSKVLSTVAKDYGFAAKEVEPVVDARLIKVFHDAYKFRQLQQAKPEINKKVVAVPKVVKPGSADKSNPASEAAQALETKLRKSGDWRDAAKLYLARQKQK
jgi:hypothetical protein